MERNVPKHECKTDVCDGVVTCGGKVWESEPRRSLEPRDKVRVEVRTAHLVHVELALPSSELSVAGCEVPDEVVAGRKNQNISEYIYWKKNKSQVQKNETYGLWWQWTVLMDFWETLGVIQGKKTVFIFSVKLSLLIWSSISGGSSVSWKRTHLPSLSQSYTSTLIVLKWKRESVLPFLKGSLNQWK